MIGVPSLGGRRHRPRPGAGRRREPGGRPPAVPMRAEAGQATVELALVLPFVCGLLLLVVQVALVSRSQILLTHATREAARAVALDGDAAGAAEVGRGASRLDPDRLGLTLEPSADPTLVGVLGQYRQALVVPLINLIRREVTLDSRLVVRVEPP